MHYLYRITNGINGKMYIGRTVNPNKRWKAHQRDSQRIIKPQYIHRAMEKYGIVNFTFEVIAQSLTQDDANWTEEQLIKQYDSRNHDKGYNLAPGGIGFVQGHPALANSGSFKKGQYNAGNCVGHTAKPNKGSFKSGHKLGLGKPRSEETKRKISETLKAKNANA